MYKQSIGYKVLESHNDKALISTERRHFTSVQRLLHCNQTMPQACMGMQFTQLLRLGGTPALLFTHGNKPS